MGEWCINQIDSEYIMQRFRSNGMDHLLLLIFVLFWFSICHSAMKVVACKIRPSCSTSNL